MRYEMTDREWSIIQPILPDKPRGVPRVNDRRVLNGIFWVLRSGAPWRDLPDCYGPYTTCYNRFNRWRKAGIWDDILAAITDRRDADLIAEVNDDVAAYSGAQQPHRSVDGQLLICLPIHRFGTAIRC